MRKEVIVCDDCGDEIEIPKKGKVPKCDWCEKDLCDCCSYDTDCEDGDAVFVDFIFKHYFGKNGKICDDCKNELTDAIQEYEFMEALIGEGEELKSQIKKALMLSKIKGKKDD